MSGPRSRVVTPDREAYRLREAIRENNRKRVFAHYRGLMFTAIGRARIAKLKGKASLRRANVLVALQYRAKVAIWSKRLY